MLQVGFHQVGGSLKIQVIAGDGGRGIRIFKPTAGSERHGDTEEDGAEAFDAGKAFRTEKGIGFQQQLAEALVELLPVGFFKLKPDGVFGSETVDFEDNL